MLVAGGLQDPSVENLADTSSVRQVDQPAMAQLRCGIVELVEVVQARPGECMIRKMSRNSGFTKVELIFTFLVILIIASIAVPGLLSSQRASNERKRVTNLKILVSAEADFRANDRDGNGVNDFWTADVKGLHTMTSAAVRGSADPTIKLVPCPLAAADGDDTFHSAGGENLQLSKFSPSDPLDGYWFMALVTDKSPEILPAERGYKADTKGTPPMGAVHNMSRFGFVVFPDTPRGSETILRVNENNTIFSEWIKPRENPGPAGPGFKNVPSWYLEWPSDEERKKLGCGRPNFCCSDNDTRR